MLKFQRKKIERTCSCGAKYPAYDLGPFTKSICDKCLSEWEVAEKHRQESEALLQAAREQRERVARAHIPINWGSTFFETSEPKIHAAAFASCQNYANNFTRDSKSLIIYSEVLGSGKTHLAICIANHLLHKRHMETRYIKAADILMAVKGTYNNISRDNEKQVMDKLLSTRVLLIDDLGVNAATDWSAEIFWAIFDRRIEDKLPVIVTTNYEPKDDALGERIGNGALSRLLGLCGDNIITFKGKDLRRGR